MVLKPFENQSLVSNSALKEKSEKIFFKAKTRLSDHKSIERIQKTNFSKFNAKLAVVDCLELPNLNVFFSSKNPGIYSIEKILKNDSFIESEKPTFNMSEKTPKKASQQVNTI